LRLPRMYRPVRVAKRRQEHQTHAYVVPTVLNHPKMIYKRSA
jgi:hypothetical protein